MRVKGAGEKEGKRFNVTICQVNFNVLNNLKRVIRDILEDPDVTANIYCK